MLIIPKVTKLELTEKTMTAVLSALSELPYKIAQPALAELEAQVATQQPAT